MEKEAQVLKDMQEKEKEILESDSADKKSIHIGNVNGRYKKGLKKGTQKVQQIYSPCGTIERVTILCDKFTVYLKSHKKGHPKGFAYVEFKDAESVTKSLVLNESMFKGRVLIVTPKRTNLPAFMRGRGRGRGRATRSRGRGRGMRGRGRGATTTAFAPY